MFITSFVTCALAGTDRTDWLWEIAEAVDGSWISRAMGAEPSIEAAVGWVEEEGRSLKERRS
jgi:hypothetical protein